MGARGRAIFNATHDALEDAGQAEHVVGHVEVPVRNAGAAGALAISIDVLLLRRDAQRREVHTVHAAELPRREPPGHAVIGKIRERMPQCGKLPVQHGKDLRLVRMEHDVVHPVVAVNDGGFVPCGDVLRQPLDQVFHGFDALGFRRAILPGPAADLPLDVASLLAVISKPDFPIVHGMQRRHHAIEFVEMCGALDHAHSRQRRVPDDASRHVVHHVERGADDGIVLAEAIGPRHGNIGSTQGGDHPVFTIDSVRRGQQLARRLPAQDIALAPGLEHERGIGLAALELFGLQRPRKSLHVLAEVAFQFGHVEAMPLLDRHRTDEIVLHRISLLH